METKATGTTSIQDLAAALSREAERLGLKDVSEVAFAPTDEIRIRVFDDKIMFLRRFAGDYKVGGPLCDTTRACAILESWIRLPDAAAREALEALSR